MSDTTTSPQASARQSPATPGPSTWQLPLIARLVARELRGGVRGFGILIACIALGVAVIAAVGSLTQGLLDGFQSQGRALIGGDLALRRVHQRATSAEQAKLNGFGRIAETATLRAMARTPDNNDQTLVELKAVDQNAYPLVGTVRLASGKALDGILERTGSAAVGQSLLDRLNLKVGDTIKLGTADLTIRDRILSEPDKFGSRLSYGPRVLVSLDTLKETGLIQPGTILDWRYAIAAPNGDTLTAAEIGALSDRAKAELAESGFLIRDRRNPSARVTTTLTRLKQFLSLLGLTALLLGGIGVASAVTTYIGRRQQVIATYRSLGASSWVVGATVLFQILAIAGLGILIGLAIGAAIPVLVSVFAGDALPFPIQASIDASSLLIAAIYGLLVALTFVLWPLSKAFLVQPAQLFRGMTLQDQKRPGWRLIAIQIALVALLTGFAILMSGMPRVTLGFIFGTGIILGIFWLIGIGVTKLAARLPRPRNVIAKLALTNLASPDGLTRSVVVSLGAGLSLLVGLALVDHALVQELRQRLPEQSPDYYALDIPRAQEATFHEQIRSRAPDAAIQTAPMLRGRIVRLKGVSVSKITPPREAAWVLRGDRGLTYAAKQPKGSKLTSGSWWPTDHAGEPLVSFGAEIAGELGLAVGDTITVNILGRNVTARIANLREINWEDLTINFIMVFSPNTLAGAPHNLLATIRYDNADAAVDRAIARAIVTSLPTVTLINVKEAIGAFESIFRNVMLAIRIAGSITLLAGALVLAGALAAAHTRRTLQAVILKAIGATRSRLMLAHGAEYLALTLVTAALALGIGTLGAWLVTTQVLDLTFAFSIQVVVLATALAAAFIFILGGYRSWRILAVRPVPYLRGRE